MADENELKTATGAFVDCSELHKSYRIGKSLVKVLNGVNMKIGSGEWVAVLGASGSGKTTLLSLIGALERPDSGELSMNGAPYTSFGSDAASFRLSKIGFVFQFYHMLPELTVLENVLLPAKILGRRPSSECRETAKSLLDQVALSHRISHRPSELSGGEQQRAAIARAFINSPQLVLADEPTGNLDSETGREILEIFRKMHDSKKTILMVTHDKDVARLADRIVHVRDGRVEA